jgi:hypothetical protein
VELRSFASVRMTFVHYGRRAQLRSVGEFWER